MKLSSEEVGKALTTAFGDLPGATMAVVAILMYRADPEFFDELLRRLDHGDRITHWQGHADQLLAMLKDYLRKEGQV